MKSSDKENATARPFAWLRRGYRLPLLLALLAMLIGAAVHPNTAHWFAPDYWRAWLRLGGAMQLVRNYYVDPEQATYPAQTERALSEMLGALDPYSGYLPPEHFQDFQDSTQQRYVGVGIQIESLRQRVTITEVFADSPAVAAGLQAGDQIVEVDGQDTRGYTLTEMVEALRGEEGTEVEMTVKRPAKGERVTKTLQRKLVHFPRVRDVRVDDEIGYLRLTQFGAQTPEEFAAALDQLREGGARGLIVDLRGNPGGLLLAAVALADAFLPAGKVVVTTRGRVGEHVNPTEHPASVDWPLVILQDGNSASASEIFAGTLQDYHRAIVVGEVSTGKGSVQTIFNLDDGSGLRLTTARYYLPSGRTIQDTGVQPDVTIALTEAERAVDWARHGPQDLSAEAFVERFGIPRPKDRQLEAARAILQGLLALQDD
ncbi:MAG: S41 family peptidase [Opitutales bacterium]